MSWYYSDGKQQAGPVDESRLDELVAAGMVRDDTLVWREGMAGWQTYASVRGPGGATLVANVAAPVERLYCGECGNSFPVQELVTIGKVPVCANCKVLYLQRMREGGQPVGAAFAMRYAGFWIRFVARIIDSMLLGVVGLLIQLPLGLTAAGMSSMGSRAALGASMGLVGLAALLNMAIAVAYEAYFLSSRGATLGKMALGLKVVTADGGPITPGLAVGRYFASLVSAFTFSIGYIIAAFDDQKRALHDRICNTRVIHIR